MIKETLVLCGGYGSRLGELADNTPKPLVEVAGKPIIYHSLNLLSKELSPQRFVLLTGYRGDQIKRYLGDGRKLGTNVYYVDGDVGERGDDSSLIANIVRSSGSMENPWFWTYSGDYVFSRDFARFVAGQPQPTNEEVAHIYFRQKEGGKHGIRMDGNGLIEIAKGIDSDVRGSRTFYAFSKNAMARINPEGLDSINGLINEMTSIGKVRIIMHDYWLMDIDTMDDLRKAESWLLQHPSY